MLVGPGGVAVGSVSGGCVKGAVYELAQQTRDDGVVRSQRYGVTEDDAFTVGLTCGGVIDIFVEAVNQRAFPELGDIARDVELGRPVAVATLVSGGTGAGSTNRLGGRLVLRTDQVTGSLGAARLDAAVAADAAAMLAQGRTGIIRYGQGGQRRGDDIAVFVAAYAPRPRMIVFGAIDFAAAVARVGAFLGYQVTVCDARPTFATARRFSDADDVVVQWPHKYLADEQAGGRLDERTVVCVLTHDPKFDVPLLELALRTPLGYLGAMGSRRTNDDRLKQLREQGVTEAELAILHAPIGLDVGASTPEETAVSIAAEIIAHRQGGTGSQLRHVRGPIHEHVESTTLGLVG